MLAPLRISRGNGRFLKHIIGVHCGSPIDHISPNHIDRLHETQITGIKTIQQTNVITQPAGNSFTLLEKITIIQAAQITKLITAVTSNTRMYWTDVVFTLAGVLRITAFTRHAVIRKPNANNRIESDLLGRCMFA